MDLLAAFRTFIRISETGSFSAVAREVGATQPAISRQIAALEEHLGARLLQRSTRSLTLTEDGRELLARARHIIEAAEEAEAAIGRRHDTPTGLVRLGCPAVFGRTYIVPNLQALLTRYPGLTIDLIVGDDVVDMIQEGLDLSIRVGEITDAALVARQVGSTFSLPVASAEYLAAHGEPEHPEDLARHACIVFTRVANPTEWTFTSEDGEVTVPVAGRLRTNSIEAGPGQCTGGARHRPRAVVDDAQPTARRRSQTSIASVEVAKPADFGCLPVPEVSRAPDPGCDRFFGPGVSSRRSDLRVWRIETLRLASP